MGLQSILKKGNSWPPQPLTLNFTQQQSSLTVEYEYVVYSFLNLKDFRLHAGKWPRVSRLWRICFSPFQGKQQVAKTTNSKDSITMKLYRKWKVTTALKESCMTGRNINILYNHYVYIHSLVFFVVLL